MIPEVSGAYGSAFIRSRISAESFMPRRFAFLTHADFSCVITRSCTMEEAGASPFCAFGLCRLLIDRDLVDKVAGDFSVRTVTMPVGFRAVAEFFNKLKNLALGSLFSR